jgi:flagellar motor switch protein FliN/FliY
MTTDTTADGTQQSFSTKFLDALRTAMAKASGSPWKSDAAQEAEPDATDSDPVWIELSIDGSLRGSALLQFRRDEAILLAGKILARPAEEFGAEETEGLLKLIDAGISEFIAVARQEYGAIAIKAIATAKPAADRVPGARIAISDDEGSSLSIQMHLDPELAESLQSQEAGAREDEDNSIKTAAGTAMPDPINLNLVMDVELNVTLRFGQRQLTLREVVELTSGSVVELDRQVEEPVELLLDGKVIARGEAVVIDGNYGLRVTEVSQPIFSPAAH